MTITAIKEAITSMAEARAVDRLLDTHRSFAQKVADTVLEKASPLGSLRIYMQQAAQAKARLAEARQDCRFLAADADFMRIRANEFMARERGATIWTSPDLKAANPMLWFSLVDANTKHGDASERASKLNELDFEVRGTAGREIGRACALEAAGACEIGTSAGALFSVAHLAGSLIREKIFEDDAVRVGDKMLGVFYQFALASAGCTGGVNLYEGNAMAEGAGRALGMSSAHQVRTALFAEMTGLVTPERDALVAVVPAPSTPKPARPLR